MDPDVAQEVKEGYLHNMSLSTCQYVSLLPNVQQSKQKQEELTQD
jgi:hypothetical protein